MKNSIKKWEILDNSRVLTTEYLVSVLLKNRGMKSKTEKEKFLHPPNPSDIPLIRLGIEKEKITKIINRIKKAKKNNEFVVIYGDYDADGITATAILWETLHDFGLNALPFIPDRFEDGYGIKPASVAKLKSQFPNLKLIITIDNGIVAYEGINKAKELGIDVIVVDHHQKGPKKLATDYLLHSTDVCGCALAWFFSKELCKSCHLPFVTCHSRLELAAIGTIADQMPLIDVNRSIVKYGLELLNKTKRLGLLALYKEAGIVNIGTYEVGFIIAPRLNSTGRLKNGLASLQLLCTKDRLRASRIAREIGRINSERQNIVAKVVEHALSVSKGEPPNVIVLADEKYHEGVIGLAAAKLVEKFYRPAIVISEKKDISKASARSIAGFDIIEAIRGLDKYYLEGGGHPMAAGFSIETKNIKIFTEKINKIAEKLLTAEILQKKLKIDCEIDFNLMNFDLIKKLMLLEPAGIGNPQPVFLTKEVEVVGARIIGKDGRHLKLKLKQDEHILDSVYFGGGEIYSNLEPGRKINVIYNLEENFWNGNSSLQLLIRDISLLLH